MYHCCGVDRFRGRVSFLEKKKKKAEKWRKSEEREGMWENWVCLFIAEIGENWTGNCDLLVLLALVGFTPIKFDG
ncbi:hypothetical protein ACFX13_037470 [Malus domestica]